MDVTIRPAKKEDCKHIFEKMYNLALHEKSEKNFRIDLKTLIKEGGFGACSKKIFHCVVAENKSNEILGYCLYFFTYSTTLVREIYIEDIFVDMNVRRLGIGHKLFENIIEQTSKIGNVAMKLSVLNWNEEAKSFYDKIGGVNLTKKEGWNVYYFNKSSLVKVAI